VRKESFIFHEEFVTNETLGIDEIFEKWHYLHTENNAKIFRCSYVFTGFKAFT
jgi:hypothetical protein